MEITLEHTLDAFTETDWNALALRSPTCTIFQTYPWHRAWIGSFAKDGEIWLISVRSQGTLIGIAPLVIAKKGTLRILKFIGQGHADYCDFLYPSDRPDVLGVMIAFLKTCAQKWDALALDCVPQGSPTAGDIVRWGKQNGLFVSLYARQKCPYVRIESDGNPLRELMAKKNFQRDYKHLQKQGAYAVAHYRRAEEIKPFMDSFFDQHIRRRQGLAVPSLFLKDENKDFYRSLVAHIGPAGWLLLTAVTVDGNPVAFHFGWVYNGTLIYYKPSYDPSWAKHSPGDGLLMESFQYALDHGFREFDFTAGDESYKSRYANGRREIVSFKVFKSGGLAQVSRLVDAVKGWRRK